MDLQNIFGKKVLKEFLGNYLYWNKLSKTTLCKVCSYKTDIYS